MKTVIEPKDQGKSRGIALPLVMLLLLVTALLFSVSMDRTVAETDGVRSYYYDGVALDLAEGGITIAGRRIAAGSPLPAGAIPMGEFRGLTGSVSVQAAPRGGGIYQIVSKAVLASPERKLTLSKRVACLGSVVSSPTGPKFVVSQWEESPSE